MTEWGTPVSRFDPSIRNGTPRIRRAYDEECRGVAFFDPFPAALAIDLFRLDQPAHRILAHRANEKPAYKAVILINHKHAGLRLRAVTAPGDHRE